MRDFVYIDETNRVGSVYLIQRGTFKDIELKDVKGIDIDSLIQWDYMGSAEFEFGALGRSFRRTVESLDEYKVSDTDICASDGRQLVIFWREYAVDDYVRVVQKLVKNEARLKEQTRLKGALEGDKYDAWIDFWWDIDHDWGMWLDRKYKKGTFKYTPLVLKALQNMKLRWES